jgi:hypothetical protein
MVLSTTSAASDGAVRRLLPSFVSGWRGNGVVRGSDVLLRHAGPEVPALAARSTIALSKDSVKADNVGDLGDQLGLGGHFERLDRPTTLGAPH